MLSASPGPTGGARALVHLRAILEDLAATVAAQQFVVPKAYGMFDVQGNFKNPKMKKELQQLIETTVR